MTSMSYKFEVVRRRQSPTEGTATVYLNGREVITYQDTIRRIGPLRRGYGPRLYGYASTVPDINYVYAAVFEPFEYDLA